jgi:hypothetical protein
VVAIDTLLVLRAGALVLLALGSGLVLHLIARADVDEDQPQTPAQRTAREEPETLRRAA